MLDTIRGEKNMGDNLRILRLKDSIIKLLNSVPIPIEAKRLIVFEILVDIEKAVDAEVKKELEQEQQEMQNQKSQESEVKEDGEIQ